MNQIIDYPEALDCVWIVNDLIYQNEMLLVFKTYIYRMFGCAEQSLMRESFENSGIYISIQFMNSKDILGVYIMSIL